MSGAAGNPVDHGGEDVNTFIYPGAAANAHCPVVLVKRSDEALIDFESGPAGPE